MSRGELGFLPTYFDEIPDYASDLNVSWTEDRTGDYSISHLSMSHLISGDDSINTNELFGEVVEPSFVVTQNTDNNPVRSQFGTSLIMWGSRIRSQPDFTHGYTEFSPQEMERAENEMRNSAYTIRYNDDLVDERRSRMLRPNDGILPTSNTRRATHGKFACLTSVELVNNDDEGNTFECGVCLEDKPSSNKAIYGCGHSFCNDCNCQYLMKRLREYKKPKCHLCREYIRSIKLMTNEEKENVDVFVV